MKVRIVCERFGIDEVCETEKMFAGDLMLKRKPPRRFEFQSPTRWSDRPHYKHKETKFEGWLKGKGTHGNAVIEIVEE